MVCVTESLTLRRTSSFCWFPVACPVDNDKDVSSGSETDSDLEDEEDVGDLEIAETSTLKSL